MKLAWIFCRALDRVLVLPLLGSLAGDLLVVWAVSVELQANKLSVFFFLIGLGFIYQLASHWESVSVFLTHLEEVLDYQVCPYHCQWG